MQSDKKHPLLGNGSVNTFQGQWILMQQLTKCWKLCFLCDQRRGHEEEDIVDETHRLRPPEIQLTLNGRNIPFVNHVKNI
jgi:hypothetical protein